MPVVEIDYLELYRNGAAKAAARAVRQLKNKQYELAYISLETAIEYASRACDARHGNV